MRCVLAALLIVLLAVVVQPMAAPIVQAHVSIKSASKAEALELFGGATRKWSDGTHTVIFLQDPDALANKFFAQNMGLPHQQFVANVTKNINDGADIRIVETANQVLIRVAATPNSAGIYSARQYVENGLDGVRLLEITP